MIEDRQQINTFYKLYCTTLKLRAAEEEEVLVSRMEAWRSKHLTMCSCLYSLLYVGPLHMATLSVGVNFIRVKGGLTP